MNFSCSQETFAKYLNVVSRIVSAKPGLPILNNVLFDAAKGKLSMTVTDLEIGLHCWIGAEIKAEGKITVPAKQLAEFVNSVASEKVDAVLTKQMFGISTINNSADFNTIPADDYPSVAGVEGLKPLLKLKKEDILLAVDRVAFASAVDDIKPVLTGIKVEVKDDSIAFVAADGLRLSRQILKLSEKVEAPVDLLIPSKAFEELAKIVSDFGDEEGDPDVSLYLIEDKNQVLFRYKDIDLLSRLIDGQFPEYRQIIPTGYQTKCEMSRIDFQNALKVTNIIARGVIGNKIIFEVGKEESKVTLSASQVDVGSNKSSFPVKVEGESITMGYSSKFIGDMLSHMNQEEIVYECTTPVNAGVFKVKGDEEFIHLIMPMML